MESITVTPFIVTEMGTDKPGNKPENDGLQDELTRFDKEFDAMFDIGKPSHADVNGQEATAPAQNPDPAPAAEQTPLEAAPPKADAGAPVSDEDDSDDRVTPVASVPPPPFTPIPSEPPLSSIPPSGKKTQVPDAKPDSKKATKPAPADMGLFTLSSIPPGLGKQPGSIPIQDAAPDDVVTATKALVSMADLPSLRPSPAPRMYLPSDAPPEGPVPGIVVTHSTPVPAEKDDTPDIECVGTVEIDMDIEGLEGPQENDDRTPDEPAATEQESPEKPLTYEEIKLKVTQLMTLYRELDINFDFVRNTCETLYYRDKTFTPPCNRLLDENERTYVLFIFLKNFSELIFRTLFERQKNVVQTQLGKFAAQCVFKIADYNVGSGEILLDFKNEQVLSHIRMLIQEIKVPESLLHEEMYNLLLERAFKHKP